MTLPAALLALLIPLFASAGPLDDAKARAHLDAVAAGDLEALMQDYADDAYVEWVGGPLDGRYRGRKAIREVWGKFIAANPGPRPAMFGRLAAHANPQGTSIEAAAEYGGKKSVKVWHVLTYRDGDLTTEIWQITPSLKVSP
jgi:ketosteroid isomerase-like protein